MGYGGRPKKEFDKKRFEELCSCLCTQEDIAAEFQCHPETIHAWCQREYGEGFSDCYKKLSIKGKSSLRAKQFAVAMGGNTPMLIWLGKQYLGQRETLPEGQADGELMKMFRHVYESHATDSKKHRDDKIENQSS